MMEAVGFSGFQNFVNRKLRTGGSSKRGITFEYRNEAMCMQYTGGVNKLINATPFLRTGMRRDFDGPAPHTQIFPDLVLGLVN